MAAVTTCSDFGAPQNKVSHCCHCFPIYLPWSDGMILVFWMLSFKPTFSLSSFTFIKRLFSSSSLSAIRVVLSAYLRLGKSISVISRLPTSMYSSYNVLYSLKALGMLLHSSTICPQRTPSTYPSPQNPCISSGPVVLMRFWHI